MLQYPITFFHFTTRVYLQTTSIKIVRLGIILFYIFSVWIIYSYIKLLEENYLEKEINTAKSYFNLMVDTRKWNASHGGVYVKKHGNLEPNKYLINNVLRTDNNETLIRINPAWMTRQISEVSADNEHISFRITSLSPKNPNNLAKEFEQEALTYLLKNSSQSAYYQFQMQEQEKKLDYMGTLKARTECLECHKNVSVGDILGGIHITLPLDHYDNKVNNTTLMILILLLITIVFTALLYTLERFVKELKFKEKRERELILETKQSNMYEMVQMIGHQWRQPLNIINTTITILIMELENREPKDEKMIVTLEKLTHTILDLSATIDLFSHDFIKRLEPELISINEIEKILFQIIEGDETFNKIEIIKENNSTLKSKIIKNELLQSCFNIFKNAQEAFVINQINHPKITFKTWDKENYINLSICNNGGSMNDTELAQAFEPYFTTKSLNGKGLGLTIAKLIIENGHSGKISIFNKDDGVCVHMKLPITDA